jgi:DNA-binding NarL/FixJ family response regulator
MISVLIADDHGVIRDGLGRLIGGFEDMEVAGVASDGEEAVARTRELTPDVVLMDLDMPKLDGIGATKRITSERPGTAVLVLTSFSDRPRILGALEAGAVGYLLKDAASDDVAEGIRAAARGESPLARSSPPAPSRTRSPPSPSASATCSTCSSRGWPTS